MVSLSFSLQPGASGKPPRELRGGLAPFQAQRPEVLRVEVDSLEVLGGHGEESLERLIEELLRLGETLAGGATAATALFGPEPVELSVARGPERALLTLVVHGMPPRLLLHRQALSLEDLLGEIAALARSVASGIVGPEPATSRLRRRLKTRAGHLERSPRPLSALPAEASIPEMPGRRRWEQVLDPRLLLRLDCDPGPEELLLASSQPGLLSLVHRGRGDDEAACLWRHRGLLLPFLEALLPLLEETLLSLDGGSFTPFSLGEIEIAPGPAAVGIRVGDQALSLGLPEFLAGLLEIFEGYLSTSLATASTTHLPPPARLLEIDEARRALLARALLDREDRAVPLPATDPEVPGGRAGGPGPVFGPGSLRHVGLARRWVQELALDRVTDLCAHRRTLLVSSAHTQLLVAADTGRLRCRIDEALSGLPGQGTADLFLLEPDGVSRRSSTGATRWRQALGHAPDAPWAVGPERLHLFEEPRRLTALETEGGRPIWSAISATAPGGSRWLISAGEELLVADESGVLEFYGSEGDCRFRTRVSLHLCRPPLPLGPGRLLLLGTRGQRFGALLLTGSDHGANPFLPLPLSGLRGLRSTGTRLLIWGPGLETAPGEEILISLPLPRLSPATVLLQAMGPLTVEPYRRGYLAVDGTGRCHAPQTAPGAGARIELGVGPLSLLRFGEVFVATAEQLAVLPPDGERVLGRFDLAPSEGPVRCRRGPGRTVSLVDEHGCLQRFAVAGHLSVV